MDLFEKDEFIAKRKGKAEKRKEKQQNNRYDEKWVNKKLKKPEQNCKVINENISA